MTPVPRLALAALISLASPALAATVCRQDALGTTVCTGPAARPQPRPLVVPVQALDRVAPAPPVTGDPGFVPARERGTLGTITTNRPLPGLCRPDTLGNLRCQ